MSDSPLDRPAPANVFGKFPRQGGEMVIAGMPVSELVARHPTPLYVYDGAALRAKHERIRKALPPELQITYAVKANPHVGLLALLNGLYDGFDLASGGELERALQAGAPAARCSFAGPGKSVAEIGFAIRSGIGSISIESERELDHIEQACDALGLATRVLVRVNPKYELGGAGLKMGGGSKQFGVDSERVPALIERIRRNPKVGYGGVHIFSGTQNLSASSLLDVFAKNLEYIDSLASETRIDPAIANLGGGFGIPYFKNDPELDLEAVGHGLRSQVSEFSRKRPGIRLKIELGRYLVGEAGVYLSTVRYRKDSRGQVFLVLDGGMHQYLAATGNLSLSPIKRQMQLGLATRQSAQLEKVNVVGPLCTPLDTFGMNLELPRADEGDVIIIPNAGAYGYSMSPLAFLSHPFPQELLIP